MSEELSAGVKILIQRMETNPSEFASSDIRAGSKWGEIVEGILEAQAGQARGLIACLTKEELAALFTAYTKISRKEFDAVVMRKLLVDDIYNQELSNKIRMDKIYMNGAGRVGQQAQVEYRQEEYRQRLEELQRIQGMK